MTKKSGFSSKKKLNSEQRRKQNIYEQQNCRGEADQQRSSEAATSSTSIFGQSSSAAYQPTIHEISTASKRTRANDGISSEVCRGGLDSDISSSDSDSENEVEEFPVEFDQAILEPPMNVTKGTKQRGRPKKYSGGSRPGSGRRATNSPRLLHSATTPISTNPRRIKLNQKHIATIEQRMKQVVSEYMQRPWPKSRGGEGAAPRKRSLDKGWQRCCENCDCSSLGQCQQNAAAYIAASNYLEMQKSSNQKDSIYIEENIAKLSGRPTGRCHSKWSESKEQFGCAAMGVKHRVDYYDSGQFGEARCPYCDALWLKSEADRHRRGLMTQCCSNGSCHTEQMQQEFNELQDPPAGLKNLVGAKDKRAREEFLNNTMPLNNCYSFASTHAERAPDDQMGGRKDTCKYNGQFSFNFSDLIAPEGKRPTFAQVYTLEPEDAKQLRTENFERCLGKRVGAQIVDELETLMRDSPFGRTFVTAGDKVKAATQANGEAPRFQIVLLTDRDLQTDAIRNRDDCTIIERADAPTANQVAVVWVQEDGLAPTVSGFWICDTAGKMRELKSGMPQLDPACFPLLHPRATSGWRWFLKKRGFERARDQDMLIMEAQIVGARDAILDEENFAQEPNIQPDEDEQELDKDIDAEQEIQAEQGQDPPVIDATTIKPDQLQKSFKKKAGPEENISERMFYRYRMALRGRGDRGDFHWLWFARRLAEYFTIAVLNRIERNEMDQVKKQQTRVNLRKIMAKDYIKAIEEGLHRKLGGKLGQVFLMPQTFAGSRQYFQSKYADLMTIVRHLGNPTWFVTFTGNPKWPEITSAFQEGQDYVHRADIVCRIFMDKAEEFLRDVLQKNVLGKVGAWCYSVEHQKRGMPHIHLLLILNKQHRITTPKQVDEYISARIPPLPRMDDLSPEANQQRRLWHLVTTCMLHDCNAACGGHLDPRKCRKYFPKDFSDQTVLSAERYAQYIRMDPNAEDEDVGASKDLNNNATDVGVSDGEEIGPHNDRVHHLEIQYRRVQPPSTNKIKDWNKEGLTYSRKKRGQRALPLNDGNVIAHNPYLLLKYACHINIEYVFGQKACKYIFKYLLKGFEKAYVRVVQPGAQANTYDYDEMEATFKVRYMTSMEAYLRLLSHKIVNMSHQIYTLSLHDEGGQTIVLQEGHEQDNERKIDGDTRLTGFFKLCRGDEFAKTLRYDQLPYYYSWNIKNKCWTKRRYPKSEAPESAKMFVRMYSVSPKRHELLAIRTLLMNRIGPSSFEDLRTVNGIVYPTFTEAAQKLGLLDNDEIYVGAMKDACVQISNLKRLQHYFAMLLCHAHPADPQKLFDMFLDQMFPTPSVNERRGERQNPMSKEFRRAAVMRNLEYFLRCQGTDSKKAGLVGLPADYDHERQASEIEGEALEEDFYGAGPRNKTPQQIALEQVDRLNKDQKSAFETVKSALMGGYRGDGKNRLFFIEGAGGCGKTFFYNTLIRWCLAGKPSSEDPSTYSDTTLRRNSVISAASTGIAALLLIGGSTVHSQFFVPNDVDSTTQPKINNEGVGAERFRNAEVIIIDEVSMLNKDVFNYIDRLLRDVTSVDQPFGGKVVVLGGDWKQLTPVVPGGSRHEQIEASIKMDSSFKQHFTTLRLTQNMRAAAGEISLCNWLLDVGRGVEEGKLASDTKIPEANQANSLDEIIDFCFPPQLFESPLEYADLICEAALLCPRNAEVGTINELAMKRMKGEMFELKSIDTPLQFDQPGGNFANTFNTFRADCNIETIHRETPTGLPPHLLKLKVGAPVMLIKNLDTNQGLCNGTRLQVKNITSNNLLCRILTGPRRNTEVLIPPVKFEYGKDPSHRGVRFQRIQFPVRPCFAMTVNKAQGQTLKRMGLALNGYQCFSHGQVYVAMSRVTEMNGIRVFFPGRGRGDEMRIANIVYRELLDEVLPRVSVIQESNGNTEEFDANDSESDHDECYFD